MKIKTADGKSTNRVFGLVAGKAGVGKTTQLTTFPKEQTLGISVEDGFLSIEGSGFAYVEVKDYDELIETLGKIPDWVKYVYIDSLSEIYDLLKRELKSKFKASQNFQRFDEMQSMMFHAIRVARQLPQSVFFVCHTKKDKNGMILEENLAFDGKMPEDIKKQFDLIVHLDDIQMDGQETPVKAFITNPAISNVAKRRVSPWLGVEIQDYEEPNLYKLTTKLLGGNK